MVLTLDYEGDVVRESRELDPSSADGQIAIVTIATSLSRSMRCNRQWMRPCWVLPYFSAELILLRDIAHPIIITPPIPRFIKDGLKLPQVRHAGETIQDIRPVLCSPRRNGQNLAVYTRVVGEGCPERGDGVAGPPFLVRGCGRPVCEPDAGWDGGILVEVLDAGGVVGY